jgi:hypothetical protein
MLDDLVAVCGVSCTLCPAYQATKSGEKANLEKVAVQWTAVSPKPFTAADIVCDGCRVNGRKSSFCATCEIFLCAQSRGFVTCVHCPEAPCPKIKHPLARASIKKLKNEIGTK